MTSYPYLNAGNRPVPNFPTPPARQVISENMPNDLRADGRNYYTEVSFSDYRSAFWGTNNLLNPVLDAISGISDGTTIGGIIGSVGGTTAAPVLGSIRLPIPNTINDVSVLNWKIRSGTSDFGSLIGGMAGQNLQVAGSVAINAVGALTGKALNPLLYAAFNQAEFRQFTFDWILAPRTRKESETLKKIVRAFKAASLPSGSGLILDYPLVANVRMYPKNLDGLATFWPMIINSVSINYTANPGGPSFFEDTGAPTIATLRVALTETKMRRREEVINGIG